MAIAQSDRKRIVVLGAGVSGLTTALLLSRNPGYEISVFAKDMPGEFNLYYASPWAGASFAPHVRGLARGMRSLTDVRVSQAGTKLAEWDRDTWTELSRLAEHSPEAGVHFQVNKIFTRTEDTRGPVGDWLKALMRPEGPWFQDFIPDYRALDADSLPTGYDGGFQFKSVAINTALYLPWLASQCLKAGVTIHRATFQHIDEAFRARHDSQLAHLVVNCCGLGASTLGGVQDSNMMPVRGQTVLVRNEVEESMVEASGADGIVQDELIYIIPRAAGGGTILGGCYQKYQTNPIADPAITERILQRAAKICPALTGGRGPEAFDVVQANVGLRPCREGGTRVEIERLDKTRIVVHNYGHGGFGFQCSWGCSMEVVELIKEALQS